LRRTSPRGVDTPNPNEPGWELWLYRRRRRGGVLTVEENTHLDTLEPWYPRFEQMAVEHDEQDQRIRAEIAKHSHGYPWHKGPGGGLPFDWSDSELPRLRPRDWTQIRHIRFHRVTSPRVPKQRIRPVSHSREHRPGATRRTASSSSTSGQDPSDPDEPPASERRCAAPWCEHLVYGPPRQRFCRTERCDRARAAERQRRHRTGDLTETERERLDDARRAGYVGYHAFAEPEKHALAFLWKYTLVPGADLGELEALLHRPVCRCNGHHIDGGTVGCFKCGQPRAVAV